MKTTRLFSVLMAMCLSLGVYAVDWSTIAFIGDGAGGGKYTDKYKVEVVDGLKVINIQHPGFATEAGIYVEAPTGISSCNVSSNIQGAGVVMHLSAFTAKETAVEIVHATGTLNFLVYYADGGAGGETEEVAVNLALNKPVVAGFSATPAAEAVDGNPGSRWGSNGGKHVGQEGVTEETAEDWIYVDLGGFYVLDSVRFLFEGACPSDFDILISTDATNWTKVLNVTEHPLIGQTAADYNTYVISSTDNARFVKIFARAADHNFGYGISIWEFEVYGKAAADTEKPVLTSATLESASFDIVNVKLVASDNLAVTACKVTDAANGVDGVYPVNGDILTISGLQPSTSYNFTIQALDGAENASDATVTVAATTAAHLYEPNVAAPVPTVDAAWVKAIYSDTYGATTLDFGEWGGGYAAADKAIGTDNYKLLTTTGGSYLGLLFTGVNATGMKYWHLDIWAENDGTVDIYPIWGGTEYFKQVTLKGQEWNSIELVLETDYPSIDNWSNVYQIKLAGTGANDLAVDNIYFYTDPIVDKEKPTNVTATLASTSYISAILTCQAEDNSGVVSFDIYNGEAKVASGGGESGKPVTIAINALEPGKEYTLAVEAYDQNGNKAERVNVTATTKAFPAATTAPTAAEANVYALYSDAYTTLHAPVEWNQGWWANPTMQSIKLGEDNAILYISSGEAGGCFGWTWTPNGEADVTLDLTGYTTLHYDIYPEETGTVHFGITRRPEGTVDVKKVFEVTGGQWNHIELDLTEQDLTQVYQLGFWDFATVKTFILDNVYFEKPAPAGMKGTYTVGGEGADFASLAEAAARVNAAPIEGDVTLAIAADLTETTNSGIVNTTDYVLTVTSATETQQTITFTSEAANAGPAGSFVVGSSDPVTGTNEVATKNVIIDNIALIHKNAASKGRLVVYGATDGIILSNLSSTLEYATGATHEIEVLKGASGAVPQNTIIRGCTITGKNTTWALCLRQANGAIIENCIFDCEGQATGSYGYSVMARTDFTGDGIFRGNKVVKFVETDAQGTAFLSLQGGNWIVENNYFGGMDFKGEGATRIVYIRPTVATVVRHNTFYVPALTVKPTNADNKNVCIENGYADLTLENNIFVSEEPTAQHTFLTANPNKSCQNNVFYHVENAKAGIVGSTAWADYAGNTANVWAEVHFTDAAAGDLSLAPESDGDKNLAVPAIADVTTDIEGNTRHAEKVYAGAWEGGDFKTDETALENTEVENANVRKVFENGNVYILRDGVRYTITGIVVE